MNMSPGFALAALLAGPALQAQSPARPVSGQRVVLVTGSTSGLGREVALRLAAGGAFVIVHGRDSARGAEVVREIEQAGKGSARFYAADFASNGEVRRFAEALLRDYPRLDLLINNAGIGSVPPDRALTAEGAEIRMQVNYLSGVLLTRLLLPRLLASAPSRIVNVSSLSASPVDFDDPMMARNFSPLRAYGQSKLAQVMFTFDLAKELEGKGVTVNALHPATLMPTGMVAKAGYQPQATIDEGATAVMQLATAPDMGTGQFYIGLKSGRAHQQAYDAEARAKVKKLSEDLIQRVESPRD